MGTDPHPGLYGSIVEEHGAVGGFSHAFTQVSDSDYLLVADITGFYIFTILFQIVFW
jgi:hypothetical protein